MSSTRKQTMRSIMFSADDPERHTVAWGDTARGWMLESHFRGLIRTLPNLLSALSELERATGVPAHHFSVGPNPYMVVTKPRIRVAAR